MSFVFFFLNKEIVICCVLHMGIGREVIDWELEKYAVFLSGLSGLHTDCFLW